MTYKPGQVAKATVRGVPDVTVMRVKGCWAAADKNVGWADTLRADANVTDIRPLVVLDPAVASYAATALEGSADNGDRYCAKQIREALPRPAIEEPKGLGAVVEDDKGAKFVRIPDGSWDSIDTCRLWGEFTPVRVLSEGVPS